MAKNKKKSAAKAAVKQRKTKEEKEHPWRSEPTDEKTEKQIVKKALKEDKPKREPMTIDKTKLGVTMVLSREDCTTLGFEPDTQTTRVIQVVREKLGLTPRKRDAK